MYGHTYSKSMDQPGKVANPARGQLNRENEDSPVRVRAREFGLARRFRQSCPASACSFSILRLNPVLHYGIPPEFRGGVRIFILNHHTPSGQSRVYQGNAIAYRWRSPPRVRRHRASKPSRLRLSFPHPLLV